MLVNTKARVGVFAIALGAYLPQFPSLVNMFRQFQRIFLNGAHQGMAGAYWPLCVQ